MHNLRGILSNFVICVPQAPHGTHIFSLFLPFLATTKLCAFSHVHHNYKINDSSCSIKQTDAIAHLVLLTAIHFKCIKISKYFLVIPYKEMTDGITLRLIGMRMWRSFVMSSVSRGSTKCHYKHSTNLFLFYHLHCREMTCTPVHQLPSHLLSLLALESITWQEASCLIFDMFLEYQLQRPTTALSASLI